MTFNNNVVTKPGYANQLPVQGNTDRRILETVLRDDHAASFLTSAAYGYTIALVVGFWLARLTGGSIDRRYPESESHEVMA